MALTVGVNRATNLPNLEKIGKSDPYVILLFQGIKKKTNYISGDLNPEWNESFTWEMGKKEPAPDDSLTIWVKDYEHVGRNRSMGETTLLLRNALESERPVDYELNLYDHNHRETGSTIFLTVSYQKHDSDADSKKTLNTTPLSVTLTEQTGNTNDTPMLRNDFLETSTNKLISTNKTKFQIRVRILEARQLLGSNINPICQVILSHVVKQTQVLKTTSNPRWNEAFFFSIECTPLELYKETLEIKVQNSRMLRSDMLIGSFKIDLAQIYGQPQHAYINKWLLLKNDEDEHVSEVAGYLKISAAVVGPGCDIPDFAESDSNKDDVESNLLMPIGAQLKPATFVLDLYQAADLPRMDPGTMEGVKRILNIENKKELIDPYMEVLFAGNKVSSKIIYGSDNPCWNEKLFIGFQFPSVGQKIRLIMKDWDRISEDDTIAVADISIPLISASGNNGYLPCYGPTWINFYGAPREYSLLNIGKKRNINEEAESSCFRGRALLSLTTDLGSYPDSKTLPICNDDILKSQFHCRRRRFRIHATFLEATMIKEIDAPVEFEVSIGNFGNKFEDHFVPSPSSTQPTNAVFDGCRYYYLPWQEKKPSVMVISQWEDITFRLETINLLKHVILNLEKELNDFDSLLNDENEDGERYWSVDKLLEIINVELPVPVLGVQQENELDRLLRKRRIEEINILRDQIQSLEQRTSDLDLAIQELKDGLQQFRNLIFEPQNSIPDIIIWMLSGKKRLGYKRIPATDVLFSPIEEHCGDMCDKTMTLLLEKPKNENTENIEIPAVLRVKLWFGLETYENFWREIQTDASLTIFAETYENQVNVLGNWLNKGPTMSRPSWSDASGMVKLKPDSFSAHDGWRFEGDWFIDPEPSLKYNDDSGLKAFLEDVFENQTRLPGSSWNSSNGTWSDIRGDSVAAKDDIESPDGWDWDDVWQVDLHRAVDEEGWEYTVEATLGGYQPVEKTYHLCRRRRWVRLRRLIADSSLEVPTEDDDVENEDFGWEYSKLFNIRFHNKRRRMDLVRRRRWHRMLISEDSLAPLVLKIASAKSESKESKSSISCPRLTLVYNEYFQMELRVYIYQARDLIAGDKTGLSDPYVSVSFSCRSQTTEALSQTLSPVWDQTLIFSKVTVYGNREEIKQRPPSTILEIYDRDNYGDDEFLGRLLLQPVVQEDCFGFKSPPLTWNTLTQDKQTVGEVLTSCELFFVDESSPLEPPKRGNIYIVPSPIRPQLHLCAIEILCWGVRNMKTFELSPVSSPSIEFDCGGNMVQCKPLKEAKRNPNFDDPVLYMEMMLPQESQFMPPMNIKVRDHRQFGRKPVIGTHSITRLESYICQPIYHDGKVNESLNQLCNDEEDGKDTIINIDQETDKDCPQFLESSLDWWAKYYASTGEISKAGLYLNLGYQPLKVFSTELENVGLYNGFSDFLNTFHLKRGISKELEESTSVGEFKGTFRIYVVPSDPAEPQPPRLLKTLPYTTKEDILVRIYVVRALDLVPKDSNGKADPYVRVRLGKNDVDNRKNYKANTLCPNFGEVFEIKGTLPLTKDLTVSLWDYDLVSSDDLIGETVIDLENRYLTKYRAICGLPISYEINGINRWRNIKKPTEILEEVCILQHLSKPIYHSTSVASVGSRCYTLKEFEDTMKENARLGPAQQRLALYILHDMNTVPEHVETRALYNPASPALQQGKVQMWIEIFPLSQGEPSPAIDISPRIPENYELRIIIWNAYEVPLDERNAISGDTMSDIYVKSTFVDEASQKTDVHYRSMDGEGNFNWRMVFPLQYLLAENVVVLKKKAHFWSLDKTETSVPPKLSIQIWDDDVFSSDDFLGCLEFPLTAMPTPTKSVQKCGLHQLRLEEGDLIMPSCDTTQENVLNLFEKKRTRGFWPCYSFKSESGCAMAGKLEMEFELLTEEEARNKPAGQGRDEPNLNPKLEEPNRPATSFLWFSSPWKSFKFILWKKYKWYCITLLIITLTLLLVALLIYSFPEAIAYKLVN